jgi:glycosyltransferase involved in cell wall biosynthesis
MLNGPLVSILMLTYNNVQFLKQAMDSVTSQSYENWELIISDDGSTDGAWELAQVLANKDERIKAFQNPVRLGIVKNRKAAFDKSTGELIAHLDGDDLLFSHSVKRMVEELDKNPTAALGQSDSVFIDPQNKVMSYVGNSYPSENLTEHGWRHFGMYRRSAYNQVDGYNPNLKNACEDGDLFMQIAEKFPFIRVDEVLYRHRWHGQNASHKNETCEVCKERPVCNYIRVWGKHAKVDHITYKPLEGG